MARLVAATGGARPEVPDGPVADAFRRSIERLFPARGPVITVTLVGPCCGRYAFLSEDELEDRFLWDCP